MLRRTLDTASGIALHDDEIAPLDVAEAGQLLPPRPAREAGAAGHAIGDGADLEHLVGRPGADPCRDESSDDPGRCDCEHLTPRDAAVHSITSSARATVAGGRVMPIASPVNRLTTRWNCVGCSTGRSDGLAP